MASFSRSLDEALHSAIALATERSHELATLEHLLLALTEDRDAAAVMRACSVDVEILRRQLYEFIENELANLKLEMASRQNQPPASSASFSAPSFMCNRLDAKKSPARMCWSPYLLSANPMPRIICRHKI